MKILTVVIPSYNVEEYLMEGMKTFIDESIMKDIEVLIVNDGSTDRTAEIGMQLQENYPDTFRLITKENGGHGSTINKGIELATGKYFKVVDGDDWVDTKAFVSLVEYLKESDTDIVVANYKTVQEGTNKEENVNFKHIEYGKVYDYDEICMHNYISIHAMTIKTSIMKDNNIVIDENMFYVDLEYVLYPVLYIQTAVFIEDYVYRYRIGNEAQSVSMKSLQKRVKNHRFIVDRLIEYAEDCREKQVESSKQEYLDKMAATMFGTHLGVQMSFKTRYYKYKEIKKLILDMKREHARIISKVEAPTMRLLIKTDAFLYPILSLWSKFRQSR